MTFEVIRLIIFRVKDKSGYGNRLKQKCYCKTDDPHRDTEYPELYVFYMGVLSPISKRTLAVAPPL